MSEAPPILFNWNGDGFTPATAYWGRQADKHYVIGEKYELVEHHSRSHKSHTHQFAALHEAWGNLPTDLAMLFPSPEHFRKFCLIKSGWCNVQTFTMASHIEAKKLERTLKSHDEFAIIRTRGDVVVQSIAKSQSYRAMGKEDFQKSKDDCLRVASEILGTSRKALEENKSA